MEFLVFLCLIYQSTRALPLYRFVFLGSKLVSFPVLRTQKWASADWGYSGIKKRIRTSGGGQGGKQTTETRPWRLSKPTRDTRATYTWNERATDQTKELTSWAYKQKDERRGETSVLKLLCKCLTWQALSSFRNRQRLDTKNSKLMT